MQLNTIKYWLERRKQNLHYIGIRDRGDVGDASPPAIFNNALDKYVVSKISNLFITICFSRLKHA